MIEEIWKDVIYGPIKKGMYEASNKGRIRNKITGHIMTQCPSEKGYLMTIFRCEDNKSRSIKTHRVIAELFVPGKTKERNEVNHKDGDKNNIAASNLEWSTRKENIRHGFNTGLIPVMKGSKNGMAVIDEKIAEIACEALRFYCGNIQMVIIALRKHGIKIDNSKLYDIKRKRTWVEISDKYFTRTWILGIKFLKQGIVEEICREIKKADGDLNKSYEEIKLWGEPTIPKEYVIAIANKAYWVGVSNKFFKDEYKLEFYSEKFNDYRN